MFGNCKDCKHVTVGDTVFPDGYPFIGWGTCQAIPENVNNDWKKEASEGLLAYTYDYEGYSSGIYVGPDFGCAYFEQKET